MTVSAPAGARRPRGLLRSRGTAARARYRRPSQIGLVSAAIGPGAPSAPAPAATFRTSARTYAAQLTRWSSHSTTPDAGSTP